MTLDPLFDFTGKLALVTGGSRGLGRQMVLALARRGADIIIASRKLDACEKVAEEVRALGRHAAAFATHVGRWDECDKLVEAVYSQFGRVDILINNAGMSPACPSHETSEKLFDAVINLNFKGAFRLASLVGHRMSQGAGGCIINISSTGALMPLPGVAPYGGAKAALNAMTVSLAKEYAPKVRVNTLSAGPFATQAHGDWTDEEITKFTNFLRRPGEPREIETAMLALASPASTFITGALIQVDGGQH